MSGIAFMAFKYYPRGPDNWHELSNRMQPPRLYRVDAFAHQGAMVGIAFTVPNVRGMHEIPSSNPRDLYNFVVYWNMP